MRLGDLAAMSLGNYARSRLRSALTTAGVAVIPGNIARLVAPNVTAAIGKLVTLRIGGAVRLGSTRIGGSGTPRDYPVTIVGVFDEAASQTSVRIPLEDALVAGADNRGLTADSLRQQTGYSGIAIEADDSTNVAEIERIIRELNPRTNPAPIFVVGPDLALGALGLAILVALVAGFLPARRAMRMSALSALRYE